MKDLNELNKYRVPWPETYLKLQGITKNDLDPRHTGAFVVDYKSLTGTVEYLRILASTGKGWDHVSISLETRCPTWAEMEYVKRLFFKDNEVAMQLHMPPEKHINNHPYCLHLWRPNGLKKIPLPPPGMV